MIEEWENRDPEKPLFMHVVTMQNHTTYNEKNYPEEELVGIQSAPAGISGHTLGALRDFATGVREADAMLAPFPHRSQALPTNPLRAFFRGSQSPPAQ